MMMMSRSLLHGNLTRIFALEIEAWRDYLNDNSVSYIALLVWDKMKAFPSLKMGY